MKKKTKARKRTKRKVSNKDNNIKPKIFISVAILALIVIVGVLYQFTGVGKAIFKVDTPLDTIDGVDMAAYEAIEINVETVETLKFKMKTTASSTSKLFTININIDEEGILEYSLLEHNILLAKGLLGGTVLSSGDLYLDGDELADTQLSYSNNYLKILNTNYIEPAASNITLINGATKIPYAGDEKIIGAVLNQPLNLIFNVTSTVPPDVIAYWKNGTNLTETEFVVIDTGDNYTTINLTWTPTVETAYSLTVKAVTGDKVTTETYILSVGGIIYALDEENYPKIEIKETETGKYLATLTLSGNKMLPFSVPCGEIELASFTGKGKISAISSYSQSVQRWKEGIPSEIDYLKENKGYLLDLNAAETALTLTMLCSLDSGALPPKDPSSLTKLPNLVAGWNLVGVSGYVPVTLEKMNTKVTGGMQIIFASAISNSGATFEEVTEFEPGKAYWIKIG